MKSIKLGDLSIGATFFDADGNRYEVLREIGAARHTRCVERAKGKRATIPQFVSGEREVLIPN